MLGTGMVIPSMGKTSTYPCTNIAHNIKMIIHGNEDILNTGRIPCIGQGMVLKCQWRYKPFKKDQGRCRWKPNCNILFLWYAEWLNHRRLYNVWCYVIPSAVPSALCIHERYVASLNFYSFQWYFTLTMASWYVNTTCTTGHLNGEAAGGFH